MKRQNIENGLALLGALVVLIGVSFAAGSAIAAERLEVETTAVAIHKAADATLAGARAANASSAAKAARSIARDNGASLDIELQDRTSMLIAGAK